MLTGLALCLLACSPAADDEREAAPPAERPASAPARPALPAPARERAPARRSDDTRTAGGYWQYFDEAGHVRVAARLDDVPASQRSSASRVAGAPAAPPHSVAYAAAAKPVSAGGSPEVVLYMTSTCPWCKRAETYLEQHGLSHVDKNVDEDESARAEYLQLTGGRPGVPVLVVGDRWMQGWNPQSLESLLAEAQ